MNEDMNEDMNAADMEIYWSWLCSCPILTRTQIRSLIGYFGTPREIFTAPPSEFAAFRKTGLKWIDNLLSYKESCTLEKSRWLLKEKDLRFVSREDPAFPGRLLNLPDCPWGLFYRGKLPAEDRLSIAVIGARRCSNYGAKMAAYLGSQLAGRHVQVISGMAAGIDGMSQKACVQEGGESFAVLGCGADICYPPENSRLYRLLPEKGGILSEYGPATPPLAGNFPLRNRIISGLADAVIVVEARKKSGSLITADLALDQGKDVYAVPGRFGDELSFGCNHLIEQGAALFSSVDGMLEDLKMGKDFPVCAAAPHTAEQVIRLHDRRCRQEEEQEQEKKDKSQMLSLTDQEKRIYEKLDFDSKGFDQLLAETGLSMGELTRGLLALQMKSAALEVSRNRYVKASVGSL